MKRTVKAAHNKGSVPRSAVRRAVKAARSHPERDIQIKVASFLALMEMRGHLTYFHPPNGGSRGAKEGANFKRMGVRAGVPDLCIIWNRDEFGSDVGFIELKAPKALLSKNQKEYHDILRKYGAQVATCSSLEEVKENLERWGAEGVREIIT